MTWAISGGGGGDGWDVGRVGGIQILLFISVWHDQISWIRTDQCRRVNKSSPGFFPRLPVFPADPRAYKKPKTRQSLDNPHFKSTNRSVLGQTSPLRQNLVVWHSWRGRLLFFHLLFPSTNLLLSSSPQQFLLAGNWGHPVRCSRRCTWPHILCKNHNDRLKWLPFAQGCTKVGVCYLPQTLTV